MRLLCVSRDFPPAVGGIQTTVAELARALTELGHEVVVLAPSHPGFRAHDRALPFEVVRLTVPWQEMNAASPGAILQLTARRRFDASLHALWHTLPGGLAARTLGRLQCVTAIGHGRELLHNEWRGRLRPLGPRVRRVLLPRPDAWFAVSRFTRALLVEGGARRDSIHVTFGGVDLERFAPRPPLSSTWGLRHVQEPMLVTVSRLVRRKGVDTVLRALPRVREAHPQVRYIVGGVGPDGARLRHLRDRLGLRGTVKFVGHISRRDHAALLSDADLFVMPARSPRPDVEGLGLAFLEASACGTAVVGADAGGVPDAVEHEGSGCLVPPSDPEALADVVIDLLADPQRRARLATRGRARVEEAFTWMRVAKRYEAGLLAALR